MSSSTAKHCNERIARKRLVQLAITTATVLFALFFAYPLVACTPDESPADDQGNATEDDSSPHSASSEDSWTVFVYLCGSNLESDGSCATDNLIELLSCDIPENVSIVVETGGSNTWNNDVVNAEYLERYLARDGKMFLQDQQPRASMGDAATLSDFLSWGTQTFPADHYACIFWDHGGGSLAGACLDELDGDALSLAEIGDGLAAGGVTYDIVGFDACLMASLENAQVIAPYAHYLVASEELEPSGGWAWAAWPRWFIDGSGGAAELGACICDTYMEKCADAEVDDTATLSVVDLSRIGDVTDAFEEASRNMAQTTEHPVLMQRLVQDARDAQSFGHANYIEGYTDMVDLGDLMTCADESLGDTDDAVMAALADAVVYERHGDSCSKATGLSVFYPLNIDTDTFVSYLKLAIDNDLGNIPYLQYLAVRTGKYDSIDWKTAGVQDLDPVKSSDAEGKIKYWCEVDDDGRFTVHITEGTEWVQVATFSVGQVLDDNSVAMLGSDNNLDLEINPQTFEVIYKDRFAGSWFKIGDAYAYADIVDMVAEGDGPSYNLYSTPVELTRENIFGDEVTTRTNILSRYDYATNSMRVLCAYEDADETGMAGKTTCALKDGDQLRFLVSRMVDGESQSGSTGTITWHNDTPMTVSFAGDATYVYLVEIVDIFGNTYHPDPAIITFEGGNRTVRVGQYA